MAKTTTEARKTLAQLKAPTRPIELSYEGVGYTFHYRPAAMNIALERLLFEDEAGRFGDNRLRAFERLLAGWDLVDDDGQPLPICTETIAEIPSSMLREFLTKVSEEVSMGGAPSDGP